MTARGITAFAFSLLAFPLASQSAVVFTFFDGTGDATGAIDGGGVGATMTASDPMSTIVLTTIDILAPEYQTVGGATVLTGLTLSALAGDGVETNINGNADALGINNLSVSNTEYDSLHSGNGAEANDWNLNESWVFSFDTDVTLDQIEFESNTDDEVPTLSISIGGGPSTLFDIRESALVSDDFLNDPLSGAPILAGTSITFTAGGTLETDFRIEGLTVSVIPVPEPSRFLLLAAGFMGMLLVRRRR